MGPDHEALKRLAEGLKCFQRFWGAMNWGAVNRGGAVAALDAARSLWKPVGKGMRPG